MGSKIEDLVLKECDKILDFFHAKASHHHKKNRVEGLRNEDGTWVLEEKGLCNVTKNYFEKPFNSECNGLFKDIIDKIPRCVTEDMNARLDSPVEDKEITVAFKQMDPRYAPGVDGISRPFYKENWETVGNDMVRFCKEIFNGDRNVDAINDTIIILIPKVFEPI